MGLTGAGGRDGLFALPINLNNARGMKGYQAFIGQYPIQNQSAPVVDYLKASWTNGGAVTVTTTPGS